MQNKELSAANDPIPIPIPIPKPRDTPELQEQLSRAPNHQENDPEREPGKGNPVCHNLGMLHPGRRIIWEQHSQFLGETEESELLLSRPAPNSLGTAFPSIPTENQAPNAPW